MNDLAKKIEPNIPSIAYIWPTPCITNGAGRYIYEISKRLMYRFDVHILASAFTADFDSRIKLHTIRTYFHPSSYLGVAEFVLKSARLARKCNFDLVLGQGLPLSGLFDQDIIFVHINSPRYIEWKNTSQRDGLRSRFKRKVSSIHPIVITNTYYRYREGKFKKIIASSHVVKTELTSIYKVPPNKIEVIPLGVEIDEFHPQNRRNTRNEIRKKHNITPDIFLLFFCGQNFKRKGLTFVLKAMHHILNNNTKLIVAGSGENSGMTEMKQLAKDLRLQEKVIFVGSTSNVYSYYAACDAFVLPTLYEPFGMVVLEAMASGLPVIVSSKAGVAELIDDGENGFILKDPTNYLELSEKIGMLASNPGLSETIGVKARMSAERYSWDVVTEKTSELYIKVIQEKGN